VGVWLVTADGLAGSRFQVSTLAETVATLYVLIRRRPNRPGQLAQPAQVQAAFRNRMADDPVGRAFLAWAFRPAWLVDFLCAPPTEKERTFDEELDRIRSASPAALLADLAPADDPAPARTGPAGPDRRRTRLGVDHRGQPGLATPEMAFDADTIARTRRLSTGGWAAALE